MRILVTGGSGFVGRHLVPLVTESGEDVLTWGFSAGSGAEGINVDLCDASAVGRLDFSGIDAVIHLAALAQVSSAFSQPATYLSTNTSMQINLLEEFIRQGCSPRILIVSTGAVYRGGQGVMITEQSPVDPSNPYVISKLAQEMLGGYYAKRGFEVVVARPFNHIGPGQQRGYLIADVASQIAELEHSGGGNLAVGNLSSTRDYTDVRDVAAAYYSLIRQGRPGETYNVCSGHSYSGQEIVAKLADRAKAPITLVTDQDLVRPTDTSSVTASNAKIREETGWAPMIPLDDTLADVLDYWRLAA